MISPVLALHDYLLVYLLGLGVFGVGLLVDLVLEVFLLGLESRRGSGYLESDVLLLEEEDDPLLVHDLGLDLLLE